MMLSIPSNNEYWVIDIYIYRWVTAVVKLSDTDPTTISRPVVPVVPCPNFQSKGFSCSCASLIHAWPDWQRLEFHGINIPPRGVWVKNGQPRSTELKPKIYIENIGKKTLEQGMGNHVKKMRFWLGIGETLSVYRCVSIPSQKKEHTNKKYMAP